MSGSLKDDDKKMGNTKFIKVYLSFNFGDPKTFIIELNTDDFILKEEIFARCGVRDMVLFWKDEESERIDIEVDSDISAFLAKGNGKLFANEKPLKTQADFERYIEYEQSVAESQHWY